MKLCELEKGDRFSAEFYDHKTDKIVHYMTGKLICTDGMYCKILLDGVDEHLYYNSNLEVQRIENE